MFASLFAMTVVDPLVSAIKLEALLGGRIRQLRLALGMSQPELGARLGCVFQQIQKYEQGQSSPNLSTLYALSVALDVSISELLAGVVDGVPPSELQPIEAEILRAARALPSDEVRRAFLVDMQAAAAPLPRRARRKAARNA